MNNRITLTYILISLITVYLQAIPAKPFPVTKVLPDGKSFDYIQKGDEFFKYKTTTDGYVIVQQPDGYFYYADFIDNRGFISKGIKASNPASRSSEELLQLKSMQAFPDFSQYTKSISEDRFTKILSYIGEFQGCVICNS